MLPKVILIVILTFFSVPASAENIDDFYKNPSATSWWQKKINQLPWLREKTDGEFKFERSIAVVIGLGDYDESSGWDQLASPTNDAKNMREFLKSSGFDEVYTLTNANVTRERLDALINHTEVTLGPNDRFFFYWSGHGGRGDNGDGTEFGFLPFANTSRSGQGPTVSMSEFRIWAQRIKARHTLFVLDSCFSGQSLPVSRTNRRITRERLSKRADYVFTSSSSGQESYGYKDGSGGLFTKAFLGAVGAFDSQQSADYDEDGFITLSEIEVSVKRKLDDASGRHSFIMSPQVSTIGATMGEFFFIAPLASSVTQITSKNLPPFTPMVPLGDGSLAKQAYDDAKKRKTIDALDDVVRFYPNTYWSAQAAKEASSIRAEEKYKEFQAEDLSLVIGNESNDDIISVDTIMNKNYTDNKTDISHIMKECKYCPKMMFIPYGTFSFGSNDDPSETPITNVEIKPFFLSQTEVTVGEYEKFVDETGYENAEKPCRALIEGRYDLYRANNWQNVGFYQEKNHPVVCVNYEDSLEYIKWLNSKVSGSPYRLPKESEWEYAARANSSTSYPWGSVWNSDFSNGYGVNGKDTWSRTSPVDAFTKNDFGIYNMIGNVMEWTADCWVGNYELYSYENDLKGNCALSSVRGGAWSSKSDQMRSSARYLVSRHERHSRIGFRIARDGR